MANTIKNEYQKVSVIENSDSQDTKSTTPGSVSQSTELSAPVSLRKQRNVVLLVCYSWTLILHYCRFWARRERLRAFERLKNRRRVYSRYYSRSRSNFFAFISFAKIVDVIEINLGASGTPTPQHTSACRVTWFPLAWYTCSYRWGN